LRNRPEKSLEMVGVRRSNGAVNKRYLLCQVSGLNAAAVRVAKSS